MKKIFCALMGVMLMGSVSFAQSANIKKANTQPTQSATAPKAAQPLDVNSKNASPAKPLKKNGTPDMRHTANKQEAAAAAQQPKLKKDGTPDKRYKANQTAVPATKKAS